jgi:hypothetical protein
MWDVSARQESAGAALLVDFHLGKPEKSCKMGRSGYALDSEKTGAADGSSWGYAPKDRGDSSENADWSCNESPRGMRCRAVFSAASASNSQEGFAVV